MSRGTVVVTGASTGIGHATARHLDSLGFDVLAGVRRELDAQPLRPLLLDVVEPDSIAAAAAAVEEAAGEAGLAGLVNNAGVAVSGPLEFLPIDELRRQLEVNVVGQVAVTQALLPALRRARGRIVNMSSIGGRVALPLLGPYAGSKFALEGLSDSLRRELRPWGIHVALIEPGGIATPIWEKSGRAADGLLERMPAQARGHYGALIDRLGAEAQRLGRDGLAPVEVARAVEHALTAARPRVRYVIGRDAKVRAALVRLLPDRTLDALIARTLARIGR